MTEQYEYEVIAGNDNTTEGERKGFHTDWEAIKEARELAKKYDTVVIRMSLSDSSSWSNDKWLQFKVGGKNIFDVVESDNEPKS